MAESDDKSHDATPHRRQQAREQGQFARSQEVGSALLLCGANLTLLWLGRQVVDYLGETMVRQWTDAPWLSADVSLLMRTWNGVMLSLAVVLLPILALVSLLAILGNIIQIGFVFLPAKAVPDFSRVDPWQGLQRVLSVHNFTRLPFGLLKLAIVTIAAWYCFQAERDRIFNCGQLPLAELAAFVAEIMLGTSLKIGLSLLALSAVDYAYERFRHERDLRMTPQELRAEQRMLQGDPQLASRRRAIARRRTQPSTAASVAGAQLIITSSEGRAIAISYDPAQRAAPRVVAKGEGVEALRIQTWGTRAGVPTVEQPRLAAELFASVDVAGPIAAHLYESVAELLLRGDRTVVAS